VEGVRLGGAGVRDEHDRAARLGGLSHGAVDGAAKDQPGDDQALHTGRGQRRVEGPAGERVHGGAGHHHLVRERRHRRHDRRRRIVGRRNPRWRGPGRCHAAAVEHGEAPGAERCDQVTHVPSRALDLLVVFRELLFQPPFGSEPAEAGRPVGGEHLEVDDQEGDPLLGEPERLGRRHEVLEWRAVHDGRLASLRAF
jgi:hypothetical protein